MKITVNGEEYQSDTENLDIKQLLTEKQVESPDMVSVQLNGEFVERDNFETTAVKEGDEVEFLYFLGGGNFR